MSENNMPQNPVVETAMSVNALLETPVLLNTQSEAPVSVNAPLETPEQDATMLDNTMLEDSALDDPPASGDPMAEDPLKRKRNHMGKHSTVAARVQALTLYGENVSFKRIEAITGIKKAAFSGLRRKAEKRGWLKGGAVTEEHVSDAPRSGRPVVNGEGSRKRDRKRAAKATGKIVGEDRAMVEGSMDDEDEDPVHQLHPVYKLQNVT